MAERRQQKVLKKIVLLQQLMKFMKQNFSGLSSKIHLPIVILAVKRITKITSITSNELYFQADFLVSNFSIEENHFFSARRLCFETKFFS